MTLRSAPVALGPRRAEVTLSHGTVQTPVFMPVGTQATVKTLSAGDVERLGFEIILANTYHLLLRPGLETLERAGGLHRFMGWPRNILTDSGGYQVFSLASRRDVSEEGVRFSSHVDGTMHLLTPESVTQTQIRMGVDIAMCLDECPPYPVSESVARDMMERTLRWAQRCRESWRKTEGTATRLFVIVQGSTYPALRKECAERMVEMDFPGYAIGGLSVGEPKEIMQEMLEVVTPLLPVDRPRYLMGIGKPEDILEAVDRGVDMVDCVLPTRNARNGQALTFDGPLNLRNSSCRADFTPIDSDCRCEACGKYTRAYLSHLFRSGEYLGPRLVTLHNLSFMVEFLRQIRTAIENGEWTTFKKRFLERYTA